MAETMEQTAKRILGDLMARALVDSMSDLTAEECRERYDQLWREAAARIWPDGLPPREEPRESKP